MTKCFSFQTTQSLHGIGNIMLRPYSSYMPLTNCFSIQTTQSAHISTPKCTAECASISMSRIKSRQHQRHRQIYFSEHVRCSIHQQRLCTEEVSCKRTLQLLYTHLLWQLRTMKWQKSQQACMQISLQSRAIVHHIMLTGTCQTCSQPTTF